MQGTWIWSRCENTSNIWISMSDFCGFVPKNDTVEGQANRSDERYLYLGHTVGSNLLWNTIWKRLLKFRDRNLDPPPLPHRSLPTGSKYTIDHDWQRSCFIFKSRRDCAESFSVRTRPNSSNIRSCATLLEPTAIFSDPISFDGALSQNFRTSLFFSDRKDYRLV